MRVNRQILSNTQKQHIYLFRYHAYAKMEGIDPAAAMCMNSTMDLRRHCVDGESEGLCNMSGSFMTLLENGVEQSFAETLAIIAEQTAKVKENPLAGLEGMPIVHALARKVPIGLLLEIMGKVYGTAPEEEARYADQHYQLRR